MIQKPIVLLTKFILIIQEDQPVLIITLKPSLLKCRQNVLIKYDTLLFGYELSSNG